MTKEIEQLKKLVRETDNIVFFGGAGVSTESGIPNFRLVERMIGRAFCKAFFCDFFFSSNWERCPPEFKFINIHKANYLFLSFLPRSILIHRRYIRNPHRRNNNICAQRGTFVKKEGSYFSKSGISA